MATTLNVLGISGSLRKASLNTALLRAAAGLAPEGMSFRFADISGIPLYDGDVNAQGIPGPAQVLIDQVAEADAVVIATPEYNYSVPGVLKNAIDWVSRANPQPFAGKPVAIMGASAGALGTARAQYHLRQVFVFLNSHVMNKPEVFVGGAQGKFGAGGTLTDEATAGIVAKQMQALADWTNLFRR